MKQDLLNILSNPKGKIIAVDLDGTISLGEFWEDKEPAPIPEMISKIWGWYRAGAIILIWTARQPRYYRVTLAWLTKYDVPHTALVMRSKPKADIYLDNNCLNPEDL